MRVTQEVGAVSWRKLSKVISAVRKGTMKRQVCFRIQELATKMGKQDINWSETKLGFVRAMEKQCEVIQKGVKIFMTNYFLKCINKH